VRISEESSWQDVKGKAYPKLEKDLEADVVIIGGGITGVFSAYLLARTGKKVVLLEAESIGSGVTAYTTAFLTQVVDTDATDLVRMFGARKARLVWGSGRQALDAIEAVSRQEGIECEFMRCPLYYYANSEKEFLDLRKELTPMRELEPGVAEGNDDLGFRHDGYLEVQGQAKFHPLKFVLALARAAEKAGASIFEGARAVEISGGEGGEEAVVSVGKKTVRAKEVIVATYAPFRDGLATFLKKGMYVSYVFEVRLPQASLKEGLYQDTANPYHYFRIDAGSKHDRMIIGGEDHRRELKMDPLKNYAALEEHLRGILGGVPYKITRRWSSNVLEPSDGLPLIGRTGPGRLLATAFSGNGMTYAAIAGMLCRDIILGSENPWEELYDPKRIPGPYQLLKKGADYTGEFFGGAVKNFFKKSGK
jgi:glycine/D-amino acid oxidase-like deaminating enzyme